MAQTATLFDFDLQATGTVAAIAAATQDAIRLKGRAGGTSTRTLDLVPSALGASRTATFPDADITVAGSAAALTSGRVPFATTGGLLTDSAALTWDGTSLATTSTNSAAFKAAGGITFDGTTTNRGFRFLTSGSNRWIVNLSGTETGSNAGANIQLLAYDDSSTLIDTPLSITRASGGIATLARPVTVSTSTTLGTPSSTQVLLGNGRLYAGNTGATSIQTAGGVTAAGALAISGAITGASNISASGVLALTAAFVLQGATTAATATASAAAISHTGGGGSAPYDQAGSLVYQTRLSDTAGRSSHYFLTGASGLQRLKITELGNIVCGNAALATTATDGFLYVPTCAGTPTGTPTTYTGRSPIVVDSTNNKLYFYSGGAWRDAGP